jgi:hypothetical protein
MLFAVFNSLFLPLELAFRPKWIDSGSMSVVNRIIDACFFIDIFVTFNTSYLHPMTGEEIFSYKDIASNYIYGQFWIDLISSIPLDDFIFIFNPNIDKKNAETFVLFSCLKLIRILRLSRLINLSNQSFDFKL